MSRFGQFSDIEIYTLKRALIESSYKVESSEYPESVKTEHRKLLNEVIDVDTTRIWGAAKERQPDD